MVSIPVECIRKYLAGNRTTKKASYESGLEPFSRKGARTPGLKPSVMACGNINFFTFFLKKYKFCVNFLFGHY